MTLWSRAQLAEALKPRVSQREIESSKQHDHCECWPCCGGCASANVVSTDTAPGTILDNTIESDHQW